ncbi:hypothetical protein [Legionella maceachernii]|uniref:Cadherin domain-containing protein n=1 Tax=Legionella maceachernii TaxID=466 RepID=A0A0W0VWW1_9GAMM|nr:hypothetical protein [Legionella maceachernii]KTD24683.1 hypothetical protein Lmac_2770 [Legionella maceachernii]SKA26493.1 hypothetical protein SAMN02745128_02898 [Legionella maceachernii]SUP01896.1 Uncharacterised protein [Legionella maceachernii]
MTASKLLAGLLTPLFCFALYADNPHMASPCSKPKVLKPLLDWAISAPNTAIIPTNQAFTGTNLTFTVTAQPFNPKNIVSINPLTGETHINAKFEDQFNVTVKASNYCGMASTTFNVIIDQDDETIE